MKQISVKCPTRVDFSGGTLDLWPLYSYLGPCVTINLAIDIFTSVQIQPLAGKKIHLQSDNIGLNKTFENLDAYLSNPSHEDDFLFPFLRYFQVEGFSLKMNSQSPIGGGLGGSSSLSISIIEGLRQFSGKNLSYSKIVDLAHNLEAKILHTPTGTQDYYPPLYGGLLALHYLEDGVRVEPLQIDESWLKSSFILVYTGKPHHSGLNNWQVLQDATNRNANTLRQLKSLQKTSEAMYQAILHKRFSDIPALFNEEYIYRSQLSEGFTSPQIRRLQEISQKAGADAIKICGAGGGGCVFLWAPAEKRQEVISLVKADGFDVLNAGPSFQGVMVEEKNI